MSEWPPLKELVRKNFMQQFESGTGLYEYRQRQHSDRWDEVEATRQASPGRFIFNNNNTKKRRRAERVRKERIKVASAAGPKYLTRPQCRPRWIGPLYDQESSTPDEHERLEGPNYAVACELPERLE